MADQTGYKRMKDAVAAALREAIADGNKEEKIGIVYEKDGEFFYTPPKNRFKTTKGHQAKAKIKIPKGSARFIYHNHPNGDDNEKFSPEDIEMANKLGIPSAIIYGGDPTIRVFTPGESNVRSHPRRRHIRYSLGDPLFDVEEE